MHLFELLVLAKHFGTLRNSRGIPRQQIGGKKYSWSFFTAVILVEKETQAQFLIPMATSLGFGTIFTTFVTLLLVPVNYPLLLG